MILKRQFISVGLALAATALVVGVGITFANAAGGGKNAKVFGKRSESLKPLCGPKPDDSCQAVGSLTTFISRLGDKKHPFVAPSNGKIVAWSIELGSKPSKRPPSNDPDGKSNLEFFQDLFGNEKYGKGPVARLAILHRQGKGVEFKLKSQSPAIKLGGTFYDEDTIITLDKPLPIKKDEIVGLSSMTWIPMLKPHKAGEGKTGWRANLKKGDCDADGITAGKPQKKVGSTREYGCQFSDRLFYKAYFVPN